MQAPSSLPSRALRLVWASKDVQQAFHQLLWGAEPSALLILHLLMGTTLRKHYRHSCESITYCISSLIEIPPSFNMGVTNSARYNQIWGISMAMSSAISRVSEKLLKEEKTSSIK